MTEAVDTEPRDGHRTSDSDRSRKRAFRLSRIINPITRLLDGLLDQGSASPARPDSPGNRPPDPETTTEGTLPMSGERRELYRSPNGDSWFLGREPLDGAAFVIHQPNGPSGGQLSHYELGDFLDNIAESRSSGPFFG